METAKLLEAIIHNAIDGIITIDDRGMIESINPAARALFGYLDETELIGQNIAILMPEPDHSHHDAYIHNYNQTGQKHIIGIGREVRGKRKNGTTFPFRLAVSEVKYKDRKIFTGFVHDLSKQKEAEEKLREYATELEHKVTERTKDLITLIGELEEAKESVSQSLEKEKDLSQLKSRFVSMASHEFRTPLSAIQLSATLIDRYAEKKDYANTFKHTTKIKNSVQLLTNILTDFLSLERLEAGKVQAVREEINLVKLAEDITEEMQLLTKQNQHIVYQHTGDTGYFKLDANLLKNSIFNLISNAIKYSGENTFIEFNTEINEHTCIITVKDNGIGIPVEEQKSLFEPFFRAHNTGNIPGTGLGLNIVKRYAQLMNGTVACLSNQHGTQFTLTFTQTL